MSEPEAAEADAAATPAGAASPARRFWLFDSPVWRDWLLWAAIAGGVASALVVFNGERWYRTSTTPRLTLVLAFVVQFVIGWLAVAVVAGTVREFLRGRREADPPR